MWDNFYLMELESFIYNITNALDLNDLCVKRIGTNNHKTCGISEPDISDISLCIRRELKEHTAGIFQFP